MVEMPLTASILERAKYLLWVLARCDVENSSAQRRHALFELRELEICAESMNVTDFYSRILQSVEKNRLQVD